ncbi:MAG: hypothetical protein HYR62_02825 [Actinobacteria bacterium]|nr:hypothetical protein [Actinomycetota bacterium]MBI3687406.1 hypothetical protein [Actinomycetota bacterium]
MTVSTLTEALQRLRHLGNVRTTTLHGVRLTGFVRDLPDLSTTPGPLREHLQAEFHTTDHPGDRDADSVEYLVCSGGLPVLWLTADARTHTPSYPLTATQTRHQHAARTALGDLYRHILNELADRRGLREHQPSDTTGHHQEHTDGPILRVAPREDPTSTWWVRLSGDPQQDRQRVLSHCGATGSENVLVLAAFGYGDYGRQAHRPHLDVLCAMHHLTRTHPVPLVAIGDYLTTAHPSSSTPTPSTGDLLATLTRIPDTFRGVFGSQTAYTEAHLERIGWTRALHQAGIPTTALDLPALTRQLFTGLLVTDAGTRGHIAVFNHPHRSSTPLEETPR